MILLKVDFSVSVKYQLVSIEFYSLNITLVLIKHWLNTGFFMRRNCFGLKLLHD